MSPSVSVVWSPITTTASLLHVVTGQGPLSSYRGYVENAKGSFLGSSVGSLISRIRPSSPAVASSNVAI